MLVYLSKKIAIPNDTYVSSLAWHSSEGWLGVGGKNGLLRVLKLEVQHQDKDARIKGLAAPSSLTMNQTLEAHYSAVIGVAWNEQMGRLTTCDADGLIVVWGLFKNSWKQEMINNRNKSAVTMVQWVRDGSKICIIYEDGAVIVGAVNGNRLWAKELKEYSLTHVQWSPDGKVLLFATTTGEVLVYDSHGTYNSKLVIKCLSDCTGPVRLVGLDWYNGSNGFVAANCPCLAVSFSNGRVQIMKDELDTDPLVIVADDMNVSATSWNCNGVVLAIAGLLVTENDISVVQFYSLHGEPLSVLKLPGKGLTSIAWEGSGLRIAVGIGSHVYFANVRHDYKWGYFSSSLVYCYRLPNSKDDCCMFWDTQTNDTYCKTCNKLLHIASSPNYCLLATRNDNTEPERKYALLVCNSLGIPVDSKFVPIEPSLVYISSTHVVAVIGNGVFIWHYQTSSRLAAPEFNAVISQAIETHDMLIHVDDVRPRDDGKIDFNITKKDTMDPITSICASDRVLVVGRGSGTLQCYTLPHVALDHTFTIQCRPRHLSLNSNSSILSVIDNTAVLSLYAMDGDHIGSRLALERKDVWGLKWSEDNPQQFALMEKTRMYIFRGLEPEEPVISSASICSFKDLQVRAVLLDELMKSPASPSQDIVFNLDTKSLRDTRQLLTHVSFEDCFQFIHDNPHSKLWHLLAMSAIEKSNYDIAEKSFVCCHDYQGVQFIKRLKKLDSHEKRSAEVLAFMNKFDESEKTYLQMDRKDLALDLRMKLGDWFRVYQLLKMSGGLTGDDAQMVDTWNAIGDYYAERLMWSHAVDYYTQANNVEKLAEGYYILEEFDKLESLLDSLPENHPLLETLADQFTSVGMCRSAVNAYLKCNKIKAAMDCCTQLNQWSEAVALGDKFGLKEVNELISSRAKELSESNQILLLIQLYRQAKRYGEAAILLHKIAKLADKKKLGPSKVKKLHVLCAYMIEEHHKYLKEKQSAKTAVSSDRKHEVQSTLQGLLNEESSFGRYGPLIDNAWKWAESHHLYMLAQRQLYNTQFVDSMKTALVLQSYTDVIDPVKVYSLLALASKHCMSLYVCSQAMSKLESIVGSSSAEQYEAIAVEIFKDKPPRKLLSPLTCPSCETPIDQWLGVCPGCSTHLMVCMSSGRLVQSFSSVPCTCCGHRTANDVISSSTACLLCHSSLNLT